MEPSTQEPNPHIIDRLDQSRCDEMFQNFLRTSSHVKTKVSRKVVSTFDWETYGG